MNQVDILSNDYFDLKAITQMTCAHLRRMTRKHLIGRDRRNQILPERTNFTFEYETFIVRIVENQEKQQCVMEESIFNICISRNDYTLPDLVIGVIQLLCLHDNLEDEKLN